MPGEQSQFLAVERQGDEFLDHALLDDCIHIPFAVGVFKRQQLLVASHHFPQARQTVNALQYLAIQLRLRILLQVLLHADQQQQVVLDQSVVLKQRSSRDRRIGPVLSWWRGELQIEDSFLHEFEHIPALVVLIEGLDDEVDAGGIVEDVLLSHALALFAVDEREHVLQVLRSHHPILLHHIQNAMQNKDHHPQARLCCSSSMWLSIFGEKYLPPAFSGSIVALG